ncbi:hypothetical protein SU69_00065 [Thermosipho melanesiensis]|uniref:Uncharacterized protein n=1 Tax=Thermosipho melanesiensis TaxID=46541 RepID=A0ABM6GH87_9BACT|nr:hypothetical protein BW47_00065 [Thermosipho melanesiensis]OOC38495.1 hypothetical protein SU68_00065 [Thermosipho melanesiensis]OOC40299.1 hypothetical protein SU70_00065 [Thermosipho melanesiensis]OOC40563.1 hypothetical protein SU69_00065 [Thermosipho melanesiensis]OOC44410.1 hypothetical protein SU71_00065 [Thermosipho melanesiensis]
MLFLLKRRNELKRATISSWVYCLCGYYDSSKRKNNLIFKEGAPFLIIGGKINYECYKGKKSYKDI